MPDNKQEVDLALDSYIKSLTEYRTKAEKVFSMGVPNKNFQYVLDALDRAIRVAQGKEQISEGQDKLEKAEEIAESAINFYSKFAKIRDQHGAAEAEDETQEAEKKGGFNMQ